MQRHFSIFNYTKEEETLYSTLKIKTNASPKEVKLAYYKMAKLYHPDFSQNSSEADKKIKTEIFKKISKANEVLSNPLSRAAYDIENKLNDESAIDERMYQNDTTKRAYFQPRT